MTTKITIKEVTALAENTTVVVAQGINLANFFVRLSDTPNSYVGHNGKYVKVREDGAGLEFTNTANATELGGVAPDRFAYGDNERATTAWSTGVDNIIKSGFYYVKTDLNELPVNVAGYVMHEQQDTSDDYAKQNYSPFNSNTSWCRYKSNGAWGAWESIIVGDEKHLLMTEAEARAIQATNNNHFDASGMVNMGKHYNAGNINENINEGLWTTIAESQANQLRLGRSKSDATAVGTSKTNFAVAHIAGAVSNIILGDSDNRATFKFPEAEDGTRIYDSTGDARGSGKASLDLKVDADPKYGNTPTGTADQILIEAVGRAFEGTLKNGDHRLGVDAFWLLNSSYPSNTRSVVDGVTTLTSNTADYIGCFNELGVPLESGVEYEFSINIISASGGGGITQVRIGTSETVGLLSSSNIIGSGEAFVGVNTVKFTAAPNQNYLHIGGRNDVTSLVYEAVSLRKVTEEVVTRPVDLVALEYYEEELTVRQEVFECIQSLSTTFGDTDVPTVLSTRPLSYFQQYDGQFADPSLPNDRYRCVVWGDLTDEQKRKVAAYMGEKLFMGVNGNIVNGRLRARTVRGLGNGDWGNIDSNAVIAGRFTKLNSSADGDASFGNVIIHGATDAVEFTNSYYLNNNSGLNGIGAYNETNHIKGVFGSRSVIETANSGAYQGRCFMYVVATVPRANKGAYHPDLNPWGCASMAWKDDINGQVYWYGNSPLYKEPVIVSDCFITADAGGSVSTADNNGEIVNAFKAHPDGISHDGIEAGGLNGVIDWRLGAVANDSPEEAAKVEAKVENGTYRGLEKLVWTNVGTTGGGSRPADADKWRMFSTVLSVYLPEVNLTSSVGDTIYIVDSVAGVIKCTISKTYADGAYDTTVDYDSPVQPSVNDNGAASNSWVIQERETNLSVSGEFNTQMVISDPANILLTDALKDGWLGTWCHVIPVGGSEMPLTRLGISTNLDWVQTADAGTTWTSGTRAITKPQNTTGIAPSVDTVTICSYKAFAKQTKPSTNKPVYNGKAGLMGVSQFSDARVEVGCTFAESLIGKVLKNTASGRRYVSGSLVDFDLWSSGALQAAAGYEPTHSPIALAAPNNNSQAVKVLPYQISNNGQCSIGFQANELTWGSPTFTNQTESDTTWTGGEYYRVTDGAMRGFYKCESAIASALTHATYGLDGNGNVVSNGDGDVKLRRILQNGWGDDDKIKVTADGSDTFVDRNGIVNESAVHELAIPYTWTSNRARAGSQVEGVDL